MLTSWCYLLVNAEHGADTLKLVRLALTVAVGLVRLIITVKLSIAALCVPYTVPVSAPKFGL